jgi:hypothetical protein
MATLRIQIRGETPLWLEVPPGVYVVGRDPGCAIQVEHPSVSQLHGEIVVSERGALRARDLGSTNGTAVDGQWATQDDFLFGRCVVLGEVELQAERRPSDFVGDDQLQPSDVRENRDPELEPSLPGQPTEASAPAHPSGAASRLGDATRTFEAPSLNPIPLAASRAGSRSGQGGFTESLPQPVRIPVAPAPAVVPSEASRDHRFFPSLLRAGAYPLTQDVGVVIALVVLLKMFVELLPGPLALIGGLALIPVGLYIILYWQDIVRASAKGEAVIPSLAHVSLDWDQTKARLLGFLSIYVISFGPATASAWISHISAAWLTPLLVLFGLVYFPMGLLGVSVTHQTSALNPQFVFGSMRRVPVSYLTVVLLLTAGFKGAALLNLDRIMRGLPREAAWVLGGVVLGMFLYLSFVWMHVLGLVYYCSQNKLDWESEADAG